MVAVWAGSVMNDPVFHMAYLGIIRPVDDDPSVPGAVPASGPVAMMHHHVAPMAIAIMATSHMPVMAAVVIMDRSMDGPMNYTHAQSNRCPGCDGSHFGLKAVLEFVTRLSRRPGHRDHHHCHCRYQ